MRNMDGMCRASQKLKNILQSAARHAEDVVLRLGLPLPQMYSWLKNAEAPVRCDQLSQMVDILIGTSVVEVSFCGSSATDSRPSLNYLIHSTHEFSTYIFLYTLEGFGGFPQIFCQILLQTESQHVLKILVTHFWNAMKKVTFKKHT